MLQVKGVFIGPVFCALKLGKCLQTYSVPKPEKKIIIVSQI